MRTVSLKLISQLHPLLLEQPFFQNLDSKFLKLVEDLSSIQEITSDQYLFYEGDSGSHFYLIIDGLVCIQIYGGTLGFVDIETLGRGKVLGWSWLFRPYKWFFSGKVLAPTRVLRVEGKKLRENFANETLISVLKWPNA